MFKTPSTHIISTLPQFFSATQYQNQMLPLQHSVSFHPLSFNLHTIYRKSSPGLVQKSCFQPRLPRRKHYLVVIGAVEKDSDFKVDPVQAREALRKLDQQLQTVATRPNKPAPRVQAPDDSLDFSRMREEADSTVTGFPDSFLVNFSTILLLFTIFYNILFITVIKPSVDGPANYELINLDEEVEKTSP